MTYDRILVATDGQETARAATAEAITLAQGLDAQLHAVYVLEAAEPGPDLRDEAAKPGTDAFAESALETVSDAVADANLGRDVVTAVLRGPTAPAILEYAENNDIDMIVMGTEGRTGLDRLIVGSIAEEVIRKAPVPVTTVRAE